MCPLFVAAAGAVSAIGEKSSDGSSTEQAVTDEQSEQPEQSEKTEDKVGTDSDEHDQVGWLSISHQDRESQYSQPHLYSTLVYSNDLKSIHPVYLIRLNEGHFCVRYSDHKLD